MKFYLTFLFLYFSFPFYGQTFPITKKVPSFYEKHGYKINDNYSWLENLNSEAVNNWVNAQNSCVTDIFNTINVDKVASKIKEYDLLSTNSLPLKKGKYYYSFYRNDKNLPASLYYRKSLIDEPIEIVNPFTIYKNTNATISSFYPSENSTLIAYSIILDGSDRPDIRFSNIEKKEVLNDVIKDCKFSSIAWNNDNGVFYKKNTNKNTIAKDSTYQLYYHKIGTNQENDKLIYDVTKNESTISFFTSKNKLFITELDKNELKNSYYYINLENETFENETYKKEVIVENDTTGFTFLEYRDDKIYFSSKDYDWGDLRYFYINNPKEIKVIIPQIYNNLLVDTYFFDSYIICKYKTVEKYYLRVFDLKGNFIRKFDAPENMDYDIRFYNSLTKELFVSFYSYVIPFQNFKLNLETGEVNQYFNDYIRAKPTIFPLDYFVTKKITFTSRDNKSVPITIIHKKNLVLDGNNPTLLKAYGGFGAISGPNYNPGLLYFLEKGGVFAFAEIRGGGEKGLKWHKEAIGLKKINSFNDFIDASEFLIKEKYTSPEKLAITGTSYGGIVVGVAITQRPDLYKVAIPRMGVYDMLTFANYSVGKYHLDEFGNPEIKQDFENLKSYSPYHNVKEGINYPTSLFITSENDDRVPPFNSYKLAAMLQNREAQKNPVFLKTLKDSGHFGKISTYESRVKENAEFYSFLLYYLNK